MTIFHLQNFAIEDGSVLVSAAAGGRMLDESRMADRRR